MPVAIGTFGLLPKGCFDVLGKQAASRWLASNAASRSSSAHTSAMRPEMNIRPAPVKPAEASVMRNTRKGRLGLARQLLDSVGGHAGPGRDLVARAATELGRGRLRCPFGVQAKRQINR